MNSDLLVGSIIWLETLCQDVMMVLLPVSGFYVPNNSQVETIQFEIVKCKQIFNFIDAKTALFRIPFWFGSSYTAP